MDRAKGIAKNGCWFTGFTLVFMIVEFIVIIGYIIYLRNPRSSSYAESSAPPAPSNGVLELGVKQKNVNDAETVKNVTGQN